MLVSYWYEAPKIPIGWNSVLTAATATYETTRHGNKLSLPTAIECEPRTRWEFPKIRGTLFGVLIIRILLFRVLY